MGLKEDISKLITDASAAIGKPMVEDVDFYMVYQPLKHHPLALPEGEIAVYTFYYNGRFLKIGQANIKSKARYQSHHYNFSAPSTLAKSLVNDPDMQALVNPSNVTQWIKDNCERFDVIIDGTKHDKMTLNFVETTRHRFLKEVTMVDRALFWDCSV